MDYTSQHGAPDLFHFWVGISVLSASMGRRFWLPKGHYLLYPNVFTLLVAGSARCYKTTAIEMGAALLQDLQGVDILSGKVSAEKFLFRMQHTSVDGSKAPTLFVKSDEVSVMLTQDSQGERLMDYLTKLFDCPEQVTYDTFKHGEIIIKEPCVTILAGTQPDRLEKVLPDIAFGGGFFSRIMTVYQERSNRPWRDLYELTEKEKRLEYELKLGLARIATHKGFPFRLTTEAKKHYLEWGAQIGDPEDKRLDGFFGRKHDHALTIAQVLRMSDDQMGDEIRFGDVDAAINAIEGIEKLIPFAISGTGSKMPNKDHADYVLRILDRVGNMAHSDILKRLYGKVDAMGFKAIMQTLMDMGLVRRDEKKPSIYHIVRGAQKK